MLYAESPIGVGFSYSNTSSDYIGVNDTFTAEENLHFLVNWFKEFPKYRNSDLFLTGESYAAKKKKTGKLVLTTLSFYDHKESFRMKCSCRERPSVIAQGLQESLHHNLSKECTDVTLKQNVEIGEYTNFGDLILPLCTSTSLFGQSAYLGIFDTLHTELPMRSVIPGDPCIKERIHQYLNKPQVQEALHANTTDLPYLWELCGGHDLVYQSENLGINVIPLLLKLLRSGIPILLYKVIANMLAKELKFVPFGNYAPWFDKMQIGGWTQSFGQARKGKNVTFLSFATVRGAAHEVPYTSPSPGLTLFRAFIKGSPLPRTIAS
ncbi:hypothetical protein CRYUN_Cryun06bG0174400 [Craigia yunnanensis]